MFVSEHIGEGLIIAGYLPLTLLFFCLQRDPGKVPERLPTIKLLLLFDFGSNVDLSEIFLEGMCLEKCVRFKNKFYDIYMPQKRITF